VTTEQRPPRVEREAPPLKEAARTGVGCAFNLVLIYCVGMLVLFVLTMVFFMIVGL
jgi:hypothetical protein